MRFVAFALLPLTSALSPPPCSGNDVEIVPAKCGKSPTGSPAGQAEGSYCAPKCARDSDCPHASFLTAACTMNQGSGIKYCEYKCGSDGDCPNGGKCEKNIVSSICTYVSTPPSPPAPPPSPPPSPPAPPSPQSGWTRKQGLNCYSGHGATEIDKDPIGTLSVPNCMAKCEEVPGCTGITVETDGNSAGNCWRRKDIIPIQCDTSFGVKYDTWLWSNAPPAPPPPKPSPKNSHVRVVKALGSRGYSKVRVSLVRYSSDEIGTRMNSSVSTPFSDVTWSYESKFQQRWTGNSISSAVVDVTPGKVQSLQLDGLAVDIKIPKENAGAIGMIFGDPCIRYDSKWCKYTNTFQVKDTLHRVINGLTAHDALDYWMINGDLFYDQGGSTNQEFMTGLSLTAQARLSAITLGNHDYWVGGHPPGVSKDSFGNGHMQFYAQDTVASKVDETKPFDFSISADSKRATHIKNSFWYNKIGNVAIIGFSNAYSWSESTPYFREACGWVGSAKPSLLILLGHWNYKGDGCPNDMDDADVYNRIKSFSGCGGVPFKYIEGHKHCNANLGDGALLGANGFEDGDGSCAGAFGIPIIDTRNNHLKLWYFELGTHGRRNGNFNAIVSCLESGGLDSCLHYATTWWDQSLDMGRNDTLGADRLLV